MIMEYEAKITGNINIAHEFNIFFSNVGNVIFNNIKTKTH